MNFARAINDVSANTYPNFFIKQSYEGRFADMKMDYANFPVDLGIVGWRVCFANSSILDRLKKVKTLEQIKEFVHGQGLG